MIFLSLFFTGKSSAQSQWQISVSSGIVSPKFFINTPLGYQVEGRIFYKLSDSVQLSISTGFNCWNEDIGPDGNKFSSIPLLAGIKYSFPLGLFLPYWAGELGVHFITRDYTFQNYKPSERFEGLYELVSSEPKRESVTKFVIRFGIGSTLVIYKNLDMDLSIRYNSISYNFIYIYYPTSQMSTEKISFYSFLLGFNYKL